MAVTPDTNLKLLKCNLNLDGMNQLNFTDKTAQFNYFNSLPKLELGKLKYIRKDGIIYYPAPIDSIIEYNYVIYQNHNYIDKWFYAYIVRMEYENDNTTRIYIKTDPYQTWQFDITFMKSFIEREHVNDDTVGLHTVPENLETGDYICNSLTTIYEGDSNTTICAICSDVPDEINSTLQVKLKKYNNIFNGCVALVFDPASDQLAISNFIRAMDKLGKGEGIVSIFIIPNSLIPSTITYTLVDINVAGAGQQAQYISTNCAVLPETTGATVLSTSTPFTVPTTVNGYTPKNNKLRVWPYSYFYLTNNVGSSIDFHYEDFVNGSASFKTLGGITPGCSIVCVPLNYKKLTDSSSENFYHAGIPVGKYPICPWTSDLYTNWQTQNGVNQAVQIATAGAGILGGTLGLLAAPFTGGASALAGAGAIIGGVSSIANVLATDYQHSLIPDQAKGNTSTGDITFSSGHLDVVAYKMSIRQEYAEIIDNFFSAFGYQVNIYKLPNITGRRNWNYVKCIDVNIEGYIPQEDLNEIKGMFNNGVTIWHNPSTFLDYSQNNDII